MVVVSPPQPPITVPPKTAESYREPIPPGEPDDTAAAWVFLWTLFAVKVALIAVVLWFNRADVSMVMVAASSWYWLLLPVVALAGPVMFRWRLIKQRRRAADLRRSEWLVEGHDKPVGAEDSPRRNQGKMRQ